MTRLSFLAAALVLFSADIASSVPPDRAPLSPIPSLQEPVAHTVRRMPLPDRLPPAPGDAATAPADAVAPAAEPADRTVYAEDAPADGQPGPYQEPDDADYDAQRAEIWNSPEMKEARAFVMEYSVRARQTSPQEGQAFLKRLSQLSPPEMRSWLDRYQQSRMRLATQQAVANAARQMMIEHAVSRQEATRQAYANINEYQSQAALWARQRLAFQQMTASQLGAARSTQRDVAVMTELQQDFDPFYPTFDPMTPPRRIAAAASLPGDLPPGDPRNFIRGEEGIDTGAGTSPQDAAAAGGSGEATGAAGTGSGGTAAGGGGGGGDAGGGGAPQ